MSDGMHIAYAIEAVIYLIIFLMGLSALRGIRRELKRIADRMEEPE